MTSSPWYLRVKSHAILRPTDNFLDPNPSWPRWLLHNPTSVIDICQIWCVYHAIKGNLSYVWCPASQRTQVPVLQQVSASFTRNYTKFMLVHRVTSDPPKINSLPSKTVLAHATWSNSEIDSTKPAHWSWSGFTTRGNTLRWLCLHNNGPHFQFTASGMHVVSVSSAGKEWYQSSGFASLPWQTDTCINQLHTNIEPGVDKLCFSFVHSCEA